MARRLSDYASKLPKGRWILGGDWDHEKLAGRAAADEGND